MDAFTKLELAGNATDLAGNDTAVRLTCQQVDSMAWTCLLKSDEQHTSFDLHRHVFVNYALIFLCIWLALLGARDIFTRHEKN